MERRRPGRWALAAGPDPGRGRGCDLSTKNRASPNHIGKCIPSGELQQLQKYVVPNTSISSNSNSEKNLELGVNSFFFELLKGCSKNISFKHTRGVEGYLPTIATDYIAYPFVSIFSSPPPLIFGVGAL